MGIGGCFDVLYAMIDCDGCWVDGLSRREVLYIGSVAGLGKVDWLAGRSWKREVGV